MKKHVIGFACCAIFALVVPARAQTVIQIDADKVISKVSPKLYGLMTEEINYSYDGGLYGELIRNRHFKDVPQTGRNSRAPIANPLSDKNPNLVDWWLVADGDGSGEVDIDTKDPVNTALSNSLKLEIKTPGKRVGVANGGYWGIPVKPNTEYSATFYAKASAGFAGPLTVAIEPTKGGNAFASGQVGGLTDKWQKLSVKLKVGAAPQTSDARFVISASSPGTVWLSLVSLMPPTYNNRPNGNRVDLMQMLVDMKPKFLRFPGGNYLEGRGLENRFNWKETIGDNSLRATHLSPWNYRSTDGMGLLEFLEWAEDMHAEPLLAVYAGFGLNASFVATGDQLKPFVDEALEEIEYVMGDKSTKWGAQRAKDGHPEPFPLTYIEVGNEDNLGGAAPTYNERFAAFYDAIKAKYPQLQIIATTAVRGRNTDVLDVHSYMNATSALQQAHRFDRTDRNGPKIFMGEWATRIGAPTTNLQAGIWDAAFMTGLERNADIVIMSCYAPLFVNVNPGGMQWPSDLIGYDVMSSYGSPSYYVQKMYSDYLGDTLPTLTMSGVPTHSFTPPPPAARGNGRGRGRGAASGPATAEAAAPPPAPAPAPAPVQIEDVYSCVTRNSATGAIYLKIVNTSEAPQPVQVKINGVTSVGSEAKTIVLSGAKLDDTNTLAEPRKIVPVEGKISGVASSFSHTLPPLSVSVIQIEAK